MSLVLMGLNHKTAPVAVREKLAIAPAHVAETLRHLRRVSGIEQMAMVSTCNRFEMYAVAADPVAAQANLLNALSAQHEVSACDLSNYLYVQSDANAARHLCRVAAGLDSMLIGEHQILAQVKDALQIAQDAHTCGAELSALFRHAIVAGKRARAETEIGQGAHSLGQIAVACAREVFGDLHQRTALLIGAGKISKLTGRALVESGLRWILVANRTFDRAAKLAQELQGRAVRFDALMNELAQADVVIVASGAPHIVLHFADVERACHARAPRPLVVIDLAVPRNVDPAIRRLPNVHLWDMDDLSVAAQSTATASAIVAAEVIAEAETRHFIDYLSERCIAPLVQDLMAQAEALRQTQVARALEQMHGLDAAQHDAVERLSQVLVQRLMYASIHTLKRATLLERSVD